MRPAPIIDTFRAHGHKLLMYHGWSDWLVAPGESINYYNAVVARDKVAHSNKPLDALDQSFRLFMVPGMAHCAGGPGATHFDALGAVVDWVEHGVAPDKIIASKLPICRNGAAANVQRPSVPIPAWRSIRAPVVPTMLPVSSAGNVDALRGKNSNHHRRGFRHRPRHCATLCRRGRKTS